MTSAHCYVRRKHSQAALHLGIRHIIKSERKEMKNEHETIFLLWY